MSKILIIDNDEGLVHFLTRLLVKQGYEVASRTDGLSGLQLLKAEAFDLILLDYKMPGLNGLQTLAEIKRAQLKTPVIVMTAYGTTETAIEAMKLGAYDYLLKPFDSEGLKRMTADALEVNRLMKEIVGIPGSVIKITPTASDVVRIIGNHRRMQEVFKLVGRVAETDVTVMITGETGTGKELVARAIYHHSLRAQKPFMAVNCATIPDALFESELFGYEQGAFTGAYRSYVGKFERCHTGTLFFDEIGDMSLSTQAKVLRVLQEGEFERLGSSETIKVDVRILAATNKRLEEEVEKGRFREDLYYRLKIISIELPPLRERLDDLPALVNYFAGRFAQEYGKTVHYVADQAILRLQDHDWPGNVRELENCLRRAVLMCKGDVLRVEHLDFENEPEGPSSPESRDEILRNLKERVADLVPEILRLADSRAHASIIDIVEEALITRALKECAYNQVHTARVLGISRNTLRHRIKKYDIKSPDQED
ncbi:MAG: sigma-54-dependent transcriptional regulator [Thermoguttaceae bacterium]